jgi:DNA-binding response OmpR family regulator
VAEATKTAVLVVEDDNFIRPLVAMFLKEQGLTAHVACGGLESLATYDRHRDAIGLVLLDVRLPDMDGPEVLQELRQRDPSVRCCFMSGDTGKFTPEELLELGAVGVFAKPFDFQALAALVRRFLDGGPALQ